MVRESEARLIPRRPASTIRIEGGEEREINRIISREITMAREIRGGNRAEEFTTRVTVKNRA